jgi:hypothetical protein
MLAMSAAARPFVGNEFSVFMVITFRERSNEEET